MRILAAIVWVGLLLVPGFMSEAQEHGPKTWVPAVYRGLTVGKSTRADVLRVLGKPKWIGREADTGTPMMNFTVSDPVPGMLSASFRRGTLDGLALYPRAPMASADIIRVLGSDYLVVRYAMDNCRADAGVVPLFESPNGPFKQLEYRNRGLAVSFDGDKVEAIIFVDKAFGPTHSRCQEQRKKKAEQP